MIDNQRELIRRWFEKSKEEENSFDGFISLWISFNAFYAAEHLLESERQQLRNIYDEYKDSFVGLVDNHSETFQEFKHYIEIKPVNTGFIQDLRYPVEKEKHKKRYQNLGSLCEYLDCVYQVRCNLFHGGKNLEDGQDQEIVSRAYNSLAVFLERIYGLMGIL
ncbi:hypothetical protein KKD20_05225 [Patescibacteria group bacterium]|nr:hypothetical protein [Patescibacteria group bacterium]